MFVGLVMVWLTGPAIFWAGCGDDDDGDARDTSSETETGSDTGSRGDTGSETSGDTGSETLSDTGRGTETGSETLSDTGRGTETGSETKTREDTGSEAGTVSDSGTADSGSGTGGDTGTDTVCGEYEQLSEWPTSGYVIHFTAADQHAHVWVDSESGIDHVTSWLEAGGTGDLGIPGASIELVSRFNPGYSYRLNPKAISFGEMWMEVCDAAPCYIEANPQGWIDTVPNGQWCPWGFEERDIWDCRGNSDGGECARVWPAQ